MIKRFRGKSNWTIAEIVREYKIRIGAYKCEVDRNYRLTNDCIKAEKLDLAKRYAAKAKMNCDYIIKYSLIDEERAKYRKICAELLTIISSD